MIHICRDTDLTSLADAFFDSVNQCSADALFEKNMVVVQTPGMKQWLMLRGAHRDGVFTGISFTTPKQILMKLSFLVLGAQESKSVFEMHHLPWALYGILEQHLSTEPCLSLMRDYFDTSSPGDEQRLFSLSHDIASLFDDYQLFRPEMLQSWEKGLRVFPDNPYEEWQMFLWQQLNITSDDDMSMVERYTKMIVALQKGESRYPLPTRLFLFAFSSLPPLLLQVFDVLGDAGCRVELYHQSVSHEYLGDLVSDRKASNLRFKEGAVKTEIDESLLYLENGNRLVANLGRTGLTFDEQVLSLDSVVDIPVTSKEATSSHTLLNAIQQDIRNGVVSDSVQKYDEDDSLQFHVCHSPLREIEVLYDQILSAIEGGYTPSDILVITPIIENYAVAIEQVFHRPFDGDKRIPYTMSDRSSLAIDSVVTFLELLFAQIGGRYESPEIVSLFEESRHVQELTLSDEQCELLEKWTRENGIFWGLDKTCKEELRLPQTEAYTWKLGLSQLVSGYAMEPDIFSDNEIYCYPDIEGKNAELLGDYAHFVDGLFRLKTLAGERHCLEMWRKVLLEVLPCFFGSEQSCVSAMSRVAEALDALVAAGSVGIHDKKVAFSIIQANLSQHIAPSASQSRFFAGAVSFAAMLPLRSIPFRMICCIGMNNKVFPRVDVVREYNLMYHGAPRLGDRSQRNGDLYLFLEMLCAAEDRVHISWCGRSDKDNSEQGPSSAVEMLRESVRCNYDPDNTHVLESLTHYHPLQPYSSRYGCEAGLETYSSIWSALVDPVQKSNPFDWSLPLSLSDDSLSPPIVDINELLRTLLDGTSGFLSRRCGITLPREEVFSDITEPFVVDALGEYCLKAAFVGEYFGDSAETEIRKMISQGKIPDGVFLRTAVENMQKVVETMLSQHGDFVGTPEAIPLRRMIGETEYHFISDPCVHSAEGKVVFIRPSSSKGKYHLRHWLNHLALNLIKAQSTSLVLTAETYTLRPLDETAVLAEIATLASLAKRLHTHALPIIPDAAWKWYIVQESNAKDASSKASIKALSKAWETIVGGFSFSGLVTYDPLLKLLFDGAESFQSLGIEASFCDCSYELFASYTKHLEP